MWWKMWFLFFFFNSCLNAGPNQNWNQGYGNYWNQGYGNYGNYGYSNQGYGGYGGYDYPGYNNYYGYGDYNSEYTQLFHLFSIPFEIILIRFCTTLVDQSGGYGKSPRRGGHTNSYKPY